MKLLAISDIHSNLVAVRRLRACVANDFDAVIVAGDLGNAAATQILNILSTFKCPVIYVYGNWDNKLQYAPSLAPGCELLHLNVISIGGLHFTGFSGCPTSWGQNPVALKLGDIPDARERTLQLNRDALKTMPIREKLDPRKTVIVTHERLTNLSGLAPNALLHLHGHIHGFADHEMKGTRIINVSVLDRQISARPGGLRKWSAADYRNFNAGTYTIIAIGDRGVEATSVALPHNYEDWIPLDERHNGIDWIVEEQEWTDPSDPPLAKYRSG